MKDFITDKLFNIDGWCGFKCCLRTPFLKQEAWHIQYIGMYKTNLSVREDVAFCLDNHIQLCLCMTCRMVTVSQGTRTQARRETRAWSAVWDEHWPGMDRLSDIIKMSCSCACVVFVDVCVCVACVYVCVCFGVGRLGVAVLLPCIGAANCQGQCP